MMVVNLLFKDMEINKNLDYIKYNDLTEVTSAIYF